jgi:hypothetical protein
MAREWKWDKECISGGEGDKGERGSVVEGMYTITLATCLLSLSSVLNVLFWLRKERTS